MSSAVMMVTIAGASWTVVTPLAAVVTMFCRSSVVAPVPPGSISSVVGAICTSGGMSCARATPCAAATNMNVSVVSFFMSLHHNQLDATVLRAAFLCRVGVDRSLGAVADGLQRRRDAVLEQVFAHRVGALLRDAHLELRVAGVVGVAFD